MSQQVASFGRKRQRGEDADSSKALRPHPDFHHTNGDMILVAESTYFRIHSILLVNNSEVFKDMISLAQPTTEESELIEGCSAVHLSDVADDVAIILSLVYGGYQSHESFTKPLPFATVRAMTKLGIKYQMKSISDEAIRRLEVCFPNELDDFHNEAALIRTHDISEETASTSFERPILLEQKDALDVIALARTCNIPLLFPAAFITAAGLPMTTLCEVGLSSQDLSREDLINCLNGREELAVRAFRCCAVLQEEINDEESCDCKFDLDDAISHFREPGNLLDVLSFTDFMNACLCAHCLAESLEIYNEWRCEIWNDLLGIFKVDH